MGPLLLLCRIFALGLERPAFRALASERNSVAATVLTYTLALLLLTLVWLLWPAQRAAGLTGIASWWPFALASGAVAFSGYNLNMLALGRGQVSLLSPVYSSGLVFLYLLEIWIGGVEFDWLALLAIILVVSGVSLLDIHPRAWSWRELSPVTVLKTPGVLPMLASALLLGIVRVIDRQAAELAPVLAYSIVATLPVVLLSILLLWLRRQSSAPLTLFRERPLASLGATLAHSAGHLTLLAAYRFYPASTVEPVGQLSLFLNLYFAGLWFHEPVKQRLLPSLLVVLGAGLLLYVSVSR
jgi:drug/metabolite transporter (DMT)-like permease